MSFGERVHYFREMRGMTQKQLGIAAGLPEKSADVRMAQYETGNRTPKADLTAALALALQVSPQALRVPDIDSYTGLMHTLFALEDLYGLEVTELDGETVLRVNVRKGKDAARLHEMLCEWEEISQKYASGTIICEWEEISQKYASGTITKEEYNQWRYQYPNQRNAPRHPKPISQGLSDLLLDDLV